MRDCKKNLRKIMNDIVLKIENKEGFTLIELIVVMVIIAILVLLAAPQFMGYTQKARVANIQNDTAVVESVVMEELVINDEVFDGWYSPSENLEDAFNNGELYGRGGLLVEFDENEDYRIVDQSVVKGARSQLNGTFYSDKYGNVIYNNSGNYDEDWVTNPGGDVNDGDYALDLNNFILLNGAYTFGEEITGDIGYTGTFSDYSTDSVDAYVEVSDEGGNMYTLTARITEDYNNNLTIHFNSNYDSEGSSSNFRVISLSLIDRDSNETIGYLEPGYVSFDILSDSETEVDDTLGYVAGELEILDIFPISPSHVGGLASAHIYVSSPYKVTSFELVFEHIGGGYGDQEATGEQITLDIIDTYFNEFSDGLYSGGILAHLDSSVTHGPYKLVATKVTNEENQITTSYVDDTLIWNIQKEM